MGTSTGGRPGLNGRSALIVEDELLVAMELEALLTRSGWTVIGIATSLDQALEFLERGEAPDAALLDVNLKGRRVTPVAAQLKAQGVPFVLITGYSRSQLAEPDLQDAPCVQKPVNHQELLRVAAAAVQPCACD